MKGRIELLSLVICLFLLGPSCTYRLSLNGGSVGNLKTIRVDFFENNAALVVNNLSTQFTEALKDRIRNTTKLSVVTGDADATMSGAITNYTIAPVSINAVANNVAPIAGATQLTITVEVKYVNNLDKKASFDETVSKFQTFTGDITKQQQTLITTINTQLTEDIFNRAFANW